MKRTVTPPPPPLSDNPGGIGRPDPHPANGGTGAR